MDKTIEPVNFTINDELRDELHVIFDKLPKFNDRIISADIYLKALKESSGNHKKVDVRVFLPGKDLFVEQEAESFTSAAQQAFDRLKLLVKEEKVKALGH